MITNSSNLGEYRKAINDIKSNYLSLSGGGMKGNIRFDNGTDTQLYKNITNGRFIVRGGDPNFSGGASLYLHGKDHSEKGAFSIYAHNGTTSRVLTGKADGTLTWAGNNVIVDGGTVSKSLTSTSAVLAKKATDDKSLIFYSGTDASKGATFGGYGINYETYGGRFYAKATDGTNEYFFYCRPDGKMTWCGNEIRFVKTTYNSGTAWYRIWSDGWIEQGGEVTGSSSEVTVTLLKPFKNTNYFVNKQLGFTGKYELSDLNTSRFQVWGLTASSFKVVFSTTSSTTDGTRCARWFACGY
jgi:hypothetical protein